MKADFNTLAVLLLFTGWSMICFGVGRGQVAVEVRAVRAEVERVNTTLSEWICIPPGAWRADSVRDKWRKP